MPGSPSLAQRGSGKDRIRVPSCEPCRLSKLACDHRRPVCSRCTNRKIPTRCVYRKNPFRRNKPITVASDCHLLRTSPTKNSTPDRPLSTFQIKPYPNPGFQGSSSLKSVLENLGGNLSVGVESSRSVSAIQHSSRDAILRADSCKMIEEGVQLLDTFIGYLAQDGLKHALLGAETSGLAAHLGFTLFSHFFESLTKEVEVLNLSRSRQDTLYTLSQRLFENANQAVEINRPLTLHDFISQYTGPNLRWETVGLIITLAGLVSTEIRVPHAICKTEEERQLLRTTLVHLSNKCVAFCDSLDTLNDVTMIFLYESFLLASLFYGDQSFKAWRRLNHASSALFADGLHETVKERQKLPFFIINLRQQIFARIYGSDISFAVFLGRPPRVSKRFCFTNMPLDVSEDTYYMTGNDLDQELQQLDRAGWNIVGLINRSATIRWSMITSTILEDTLETLLGRGLSDIPQRIIELRSKISQAWNDLPSFLTVPTQDVWQKGRPCHEVDILHQIRLFYLHTTFLIEWAASRNSLDNTRVLFANASELLEWVNNALVRREQFSDLGLGSLAWRVASCALPAAGVLAWYLLQPSSRMGLVQLDPASRRHSIENLSVLIAHMGVLHDPGDGNYQLFCQAKNALQSAMDTILQPSTTDQSESPLDMSHPAIPPDWLYSDYLGLGVESWIGLPDRGSFTGLDENMLY